MRGQHAPQAVVGEVAYAGRARDGLEQLARLIVNILCHRLATVTHAIASGVDYCVLGQDLELAARIQLQVGQGVMRFVLRADPGGHHGLAGDCRCRKRGYVVERSTVLDGAHALAPAVVAVFGDAAFGADHIAQQVLGAGVIDIACDHGRAWQERACAIGVGAEVGGLGQHLIAGIEAAGYGVARCVALQHLVAVGVVLHVDGATLAVHDAQDVAGSAVNKAAALRNTADGGRRHCGQLPCGVVVVQGDESERIGNRGAPRDRVVAVVGELVEAVFDAGHAHIAAAEVDVGDGQAVAIALHDTGHALAGAIVGVAGAVGSGVGNRVVVRAQVDRDFDQAIAAVVGISRAGQGGAASRYGAHLFQVRADVVKVADLTTGTGDAGDDSGCVVGIADGVVAGVGLAQQSPAGLVVALGDTGLAVGPDQLSGAAHKAVVSARTVAAAVAGLGCVPAIDRCAAIGIDARDATAHRVERTAEARGLARHRPVVAVVVGQQALAVVGSQRKHVSAMADEFVIAILQHEVAGCNVDVGLLATAALRRIAKHTTLAQSGQ